MTMTNRANRFALAVIEALLWSTTDDASPGDSCLDALYSAQDLDPGLKAHIMAEAEAFLGRHDALIDASGLIDGLSVAGHNAALDRNGHGAGFLDGDWSDAESTALHSASVALGPLDLYAYQGTVFALQIAPTPIPESTGTEKGKP